MKYLLIFIFYIYAIIEALFKFIFDPSTRKKNNRRRPISDREKLKTFTGSEVRTLFRHIKQKYDTLSWKHVAACIKRYPRPILLTDQCECGCNVIAIHFCRIYVIFSQNNALRRQKYVSWKNRPETGQRLLRYFRMSPLIAASRGPFYEQLRSVLQKTWL
jgi:hypothetical protein